MFSYNVFVTLWKALTTFLVSGAGVVIGVEAMQLPEDQDTFRQTWPVYVVPVALALIRALENWRKHGPNGVRWRWPWDAITPLFLAMIVGASCGPILGCASVGTTTSENITNPDGSTYAFEYAGKSTAAPFGKVDSTVHRMAYQTEDGANLTVGQDATGLDNTAQIAAISAMGEIIGQTVAALLKGGILSPATPAAVDDGGVLVKINTRLEELDDLLARLRNMGIIKDGIP